jgi:hypothetical protein
MKVRSALCALLVSSAQVAMGNFLGLSNFEIQGRFGHRHSRTSGFEQLDELKGVKKDLLGLNVSHANSWTLGAQYQFSQDVPVSLGLDLTLVQGYKSDLAGNKSIDSIKSHHGFEVTPIVKVWFPASLHGVYYLKPFAKVGYVAYSDYLLEVEGKVDDKKSLTRSTSYSPGFVIGLGADVAVNEMVLISAGYTYFNTQPTLRSVTVNGKREGLVDGKVVSYRDEAQRGKTTDTHEFSFGVGVSI